VGRGVLLSVLLEFRSAAEQAVFLARVVPVGRAALVLAHRRAAGGERAERDRDSSLQVIGHGSLRQGVHERRAAYSCASAAFSRSVTSMCPGACVMQSDGF